MYKFLVRQLDSYLYENEWNINTSYNMGTFETKSKNIKKALTRYLKYTHGITFFKNKILILDEGSGDYYTIINRRTKEPLFDCLYQY